jgi:hypothetical protein
LADVESAIAKAQVGQSYRMADGRSVTRGDLKVLVDRQKELIRLAAREARGGGASIRLARPARF